MRPVSCSQEEMTQGTSAALLLVPLSPQGNGCWDPQGCPNRGSIGVQEEGWGPASQDMLPLPFCPSFLSDNHDL